MARSRLIHIIGNFVGPLLFKTADAPRYPKGFIAVVITALAAGLLALVYRFVCMWDNRVRDKTGILEGYDHAYEDDLTDKKVRSPITSGSSPVLTACRILNLGIFCKDLRRLLGLGQMWANWMQGKLSDSRQFWRSDGFSVRFV